MKNSLNFMTTCLKVVDTRRSLVIGVMVRIELLAGKVAVEQEVRCRRVSLS